MVEVSFALDPAFLFRVLCVFLPLLLFFFSCSSPLSVRFRLLPLLFLTWERPLPSRRDSSLATGGGFLSPAPTEAEHQEPHDGTVGVFSTVVPAGRTHAQWYPQPKRGCSEADQHELKFYSVDSKEVPRPPRCMPTVYVCGVPRGHRAPTGSQSHPLIRQEARD